MALETWNHDSDPLRELAERRGIGRVATVLFMAPRAVAVAALCSVVTATLTLVQPGLVGALVRATIDDTNGKPIRLAVVIAVLSLATAAINWWAELTVGFAANRVAYALRRSLVTRSLEIRSVDLSRVVPSDWSTRTVGDVEVLKDVFVQGPVQLVGSVIVIIGALIGMIKIDGLLAVAVVMTCFMAFAVLILSARNLSCLRENERDALGKMDAEIHRVLRTIVTLRAYSAENFARQRIEAKSSSIYNASGIAVRASTRLKPISALASQTAFLVIICLGALAATTHRIDGPQLVSFILYVLLVVQPIATSAGTISLLARCRGALNRIANLVHFPMETEGRESLESKYSVPELCREPSIELCDLSFSYNDRVVLESLRASIPHGSWVDITGQSGAGKSTLLLLLARLVSPTHGRIAFDGVNIQDIPLGAYRQMVAYVEQSCPLFNSTVRDNLVLGRSGISDQQCWEALESVDLRTVIEDRPGGLDSPVGENTYTLSGGERQRIAIARALLSSPRILLLDEVTSGLDSATRIQVMNSIRRATVNMTVFFVTHQHDSNYIADLTLNLDSSGWNIRRVLLD